MKGSVTGVKSFLVGEDRYTMVFAINAICALEEEFDIKAENIGELLTDGRVKTIRSLFRIALLENHPGMTDLEAGRIMAAVGLDQVAELLLEALSAAFPDVEEGKSDARPQKAAAKPSAGTG